MTVTVELSTSVVEVNLGTAGTISGASNLINPGRILVTKSTGEAGESLGIVTSDAGGVTHRIAATQDAVRIVGRAGGTTSRILTITTAALGANRTATFPDATITVAGSASALTSGRVPYVTTGGLLTDSAGMTYSGTALTLTGALTVPNGTAAAPGIRVTGEASGLYRVNSASLRVAVNGVATAWIIAQSGSGNGSGLLLESTDAADACAVIAGRNDGALFIRGSSSGAGFGGQVRVYANAHATKADYVEFTRGATVSAFFNGSGNLIVGATDPGGTGLLRIAGGINLASGNGLRINNVQVVGAQGAAVADATDATSVIARLNDLLARLRTHGLIAT